MTSAVGFYFGSLRDCLMFFQWLYVGLERDRLREVVVKLHELLSPYYKGVDIELIYSDLYKFLSKVDNFYGKLARNKLKYVNSINNNPKPEHIVDAILVCTPKFLSAIYYIWYDVNQHFEKLGGGMWMYNYPGYDGKDLLGRYWGGGLQKYLTGTSKNENHNNTELLLGGFEKGEIKYGYNDSSGFYQGRSMIEDLRQLLDKDSTKSNFFRDIFSTTALATNAGAYTANIANVVALVETFCEIVEKERSVIDLERHEGLQKSFIHWKGLVDHCKVLRYPLDKIFKSGALSFTGYRRGINEVNTVGFARRVAAWLRGNLHSVKKRLEGIAKYAGKNYYDIFAKYDHHHMIKYYHAALKDYLTKYVFAYGFTFCGDNVYTLPKDIHKTLLDDWNLALSMLTGDNGLDKLKKLLEGLEYPEGHELGEQVPGSPTADRSSHHEVTTTEESNNAASHRDTVPNQDNGDGAYINEDTENKDGIETLNGDKTGPQETSNTPTLRGVDSSDTAISEGGNENGHNGDGGDDTPCANKLPDMETSDHDDCFLNMHYRGPLTTS